MGFTGRGPTAAVGMPTEGRPVQLFWLPSPTLLKFKMRLVGVLFAYRPRNDDPPVFHLLRASAAPLGMDCNAKATRASVCGPSRISSLFFRYPTNTLSTNKSPPVASTPGRLLLVGLQSLEHRLKGVTVHSVLQLLEPRIRGGLLGVEGLTFLAVAALRRCSRFMFGVPFPSESLPGPTWKALFNRVMASISAPLASAIKLLRPIRNASCANHSVSAHPLLVRTQSRVRGKPRSNTSRWIESLPTPVPVRRSSLLRSDQPPKVVLPDATIPRRLSLPATSVGVAGVRQRAVLLCRERTTPEWKGLALA